MIVEDKEILTKGELEDIENFYNFQPTQSKIKWHFTPSSYGNSNPYFSLSLKDRPENWSDDTPTSSRIQYENINEFSFFVNIFKRFLEKHKINCTEIFRMNLNLTTHVSSEYFSRPHVDHNFEHEVAILYLNPCQGNTVIFEDLSDQDNPEKIMEGYEGNKHEDDFKIKNEIGPEVGKLVTFSGKNYHTMRPCLLDEFRIICVMTYKTEKDI